MAFYSDNFIHRIHPPGDVFKRFLIYLFKIAHPKIKRHLLGYENIVTLRICRI